MKQRLLRVVCERLHDLIGGAGDWIEASEMGRLPFELACGLIALGGISINPDAGCVVKIDIEVGAIPRLA